METAPATLVRSSGGVQVAVHDLGGPQDPGAPVLLFSHATGLHGRVWEPMASHLSTRFRCLAVDYRGHGVTETPEGTGFAWAGMGDDAVAVLDGGLIGPGRTVHGVGHSMGGAALVLAAGRRPRAFSSLWLYEPVIVPSGSAPPAGASNPMAEAAARRRASFPSLASAYDNFGSKPPLNELHHGALRAYVDGGFAPQADGTVSLRCRPRVEAAVFAEAADAGAWEVWTTLEVPVAVVAGRPDGFGPVMFVEALVGGLNRASLVERPDLGHFGPLQDPQGVAGDVEAWVDRH